MLRQGRRRDRACRVSNCKSPSRFDLQKKLLGKFGLFPWEPPASYCSAGPSTQRFSSASCWVKRKMAFQASGPERLLQASRSGEMELARESHFNMLELSPTGDLAPGTLPKDLIWPIPSPFQLALAPLCFGSIPRKTRRGRAQLSGLPKCNVTEGWKNFGEPAGEAARLMTGTRFIPPSD